MQKSKYGIDCRAQRFVENNNNNISMILNNSSTFLNFHIKNININETNWFKFILLLTIIIKHWRNKTKKQSNSKLFLPAEPA